MPELARVSVLSAAEAGFDTVLFSDAKQDIAHAKLRVADWREIDLPWAPEDVRIFGEERPCYAAFSDLFRFALLAQHDGWWFDCDTIVLRDTEAFAHLLRPGALTVGREDSRVINGAVIGSDGKSQAKYLYDRAKAAFPVLNAWGEVGPALITRAIAEQAVAAHLLEKKYFYPVHYSKIADIYDPEKCGVLREQEKDWFCLTVWGEMLSRSGLKYLSPPPGSYLSDLLARRPDLGRIDGDTARMAAYLAENLGRLDELDSAWVAIRTLKFKVVHKVAARLPRLNSGKR